MKTIEVNFLADSCPCCRAGRSAQSDGEWPWKCRCNQCQVVGMGRTCGGPGQCWDDCPNRAPAESCPA